MATATATRPDVPFPTGLPRTTGESLRDLAVTVLEGHSKGYPEGHHEVCHMGPRDSMERVAKLMNGINDGWHPIHTRVEPIVWGTAPEVDHVVESEAANAVAIIIEEPDGTQRVMYVASQLEAFGYLRSFNSATDITGRRAYARKLVWALGEVVEVDPPAKPKGKRSSKPRLKVKSA